MLSATYVDGAQRKLTVNAFHRVVKDDGRGDVEMQAKGNVEDGGVGLKVEAGGVGLKTRNRVTQEGGHPPRSSSYYDPSV